MAEIVKGLRKASRTEAIDRFVAELPRFEVLPVDADVAVLAGAMYAELERTGQPIGRADPLIAASASAHGLTLVTGNLAHYSRIPELGFPSRTGGTEPSASHGKRGALLPASSSARP